MADLSWLLRCRSIFTFLSVTTIPCLGGELNQFPEWLLGGHCLLSRPWITREAQSPIKHILLFAESYYPKWNNNITREADPMTVLALVLCWRIGFESGKKGFDLKFKYDILVNKCPTELTWPYNKQRYCILNGEKYQYGHTDRFSILLLSYRHTCGHPASLNTINTGTCTLCWASDKTENAVPDIYTYSLEGRLFVYPI